MPVSALPSNAEKAAVWEAFHARRPTRVPLRWNVNTRIVLLNPDLNPEGIDYETCFHDPIIAMRMQARFQEHVATELNIACDSPVGLPDRWVFHVETQNTYDAAYFGGRISFRAGQVPSADQTYTLADADAFIERAERDRAQPLANPWIKDRLAYRDRLMAASADFEYLGRKGIVAPFLIGFDGPLTVATMLFGAEILAALMADPDLALRILTAITEGAIARNRALSQLAGVPFPGEWAGMADDSIQLISPSQYETLILPLHERYYDATGTARPGEGRRLMHLCGDATRHFPLIRDRLGVVSFDTGFPVDHGALRDQLGDAIEISGGPHIALLRDGTPDQCYRRAAEILESGVKRGGRFILQEGNNLPPCVPMENLAAVQAACLEHGGYH